MTRRKTPSAKRPRRRYIGSGVWETRLPDGTWLIEMACTEEQAAELQAEADERGLTVEQVCRLRVLGESDDVLVSELRRQIEKVAKDTPMLRDAWARINPARAAGTMSDASVSSCAALCMSNLQDLTNQLAAIENLVRKLDCPALLAEAEKLRTEIAKTAAMILEAGAIPV